MRCCFLVSFKDLVMTFSFGTYLGRSTVGCSTVGWVSEVRMCSESDFEWKIPDFLLQTSRSLDSPTFQLSAFSHSWFLRVFPNCNGQIISLYLYIKNASSDERTLHVTAGLKRTDGSVERQETYDWKIQKSESKKWPNFSERNKISQCRSVLLPEGTLTIVCFMREGVPCKEETMKITGLETLSANFGDMLKGGNHTDVTIRVQNKIFPAHKCILVARSPVFSAAFEHAMIEKETGVINIVDCCPSTFEDFLSYLYTGQIQDRSSKNLRQLYVVADKYEVEELKTFCISYMILKLSVENLCDTIILADQYEESGLMCSAQSFFNRNFCDVLSTSEWQSLMMMNFSLGNKMLKKLACKVKIQL